jgi:hypothetical protein
VLDHVERRTFLVEPAREDPVPLLVGPLDVDLHERAGQLVDFPWGGRLAGAQPHDDVLHPDRLARLKRQVLDDAVALVEQAEHGDAVLHWRHARLLGGRAWHFDGDGIALGRLVVAAIAGGKGRRCRQEEGGALHYSSGVQAL